MSHDIHAPGSYDSLSPNEMRIGLEVAGVGVGRVDYVKDTVHLDPVAAAIFGLPADTPIPRPDFHARIHPEDWPQVEAEVDLLLAPEEPDVIDVSHRITLPDGRINWVHARKRVWFGTRDGFKAPDHGVFAVNDITAAKQAEIHTRFLIGELNHRTKNLISVFTSLVRQLSRHAAPEDLAQKLIDRMAVLAHNQDAIVHAEGGTVSLREVILQQVAALSDDNGGQVEITGPRVPLDGDASQVLAMVTHELLTNAVKHGALSTEAGRVAIDWRTDDDNRLQFEWREAGGPPVTAPRRRGFGTQILENYLKAAIEAETTIAYDAAGFRFGFHAPLRALGGQVP